MKITVTKNGPYIATGGVPIVVAEICNDNEGYSAGTWKIVDRYPVREECACAGAVIPRTDPSATGPHAKTRFNGTETAGNEPYLSHPEIIRGPESELTDYHELCVHARFCMRAGGIRNLTEQSGIPEARDTAIEEACNCPSGSLSGTGGSEELVEPVLEKSIVVIEYPAKGEHGPLWVRGEIPVVSADGKPYTVRNGSPSAVAGNRTTSRSATGATYSIN